MGHHSAVPISEKITVRNGKAVESLSMVPLRRQETLYSLKRKLQRKLQYEMESYQNLQILEV
jgi:hypothetical protein